MSGRDWVKVGGWDGTAIGYHQQLLGGHGTPPEEVTDHHSGGVRLEYHHPDGRRAAVRYRAPGPLGESDRHWWARAEERLALGLPDDWRPSGLLFRVERLTGPEPMVVVVEGESSTLALWASDIPAVGVPGAGAWDPKDPHGHISRINKGAASVLVIADPDKAGQKLVEAISGTEGTEDWRLLQGDALCGCECEDVRQVLLAHGPDRLRQALDDLLSGAPWLPKKPPEPSIIEGSFSPTQRGDWLIHQNGRRQLVQLREVANMLTEAQVDHLFPPPIRPPGAKMRTLAEPQPQQDPTLPVPDTPIRLAQGAINCLFAPANAGKTITAAEWAARFALDGQRVAWIAVEGPTEADHHLRTFLAGDHQAMGRVALLDYWPASPAEWAEIADFRPTWSWWTASTPLSPPPN